MREILKTFLLLLGTCFVAVCYAMGLAWFGLSPRLEPEGWTFHAGWIVCVTIMALTLGIPSILLLLRPVGAAMQKAAVKGTFTEAELEAVLRRTMNLPLLLGVLVFLLWLVPLLTMPVAAALFENAPDPVSVFIAFTATTGIGVVHATFIVYLVERETRVRFLPVLVRAGLVRRLEGVRPVGVGWKLILLFVTTALFPIFLFLVMYAGGTATIGAALFLGISSIVLGVSQCAIIYASIARPLSSLEGEMARVREGNLQIRVPVLSSDELGQLSQGFNEMVEGLERAEFVRETFGSYVSKPVLEEILSGNVGLGGERCVATILFSDIRGFTAFSEKLPPEDVVRFLNKYMDEMVDALVGQGATIDKFVGDAIMATFGVPVHQDDHALRAVRGALAMLERLEAFNAERAAEGQPAVEIGIGIHTGVVVAGNIGSEKKMEYTVIGDSVNTASRIETLNKRFGTHLLISEDTHMLVAGHVEARALEPVEVKGKSEPLTVYEVTGERDGGRRVPSV
ncbi:MAG: HAMP domain-containing protein [Deltaproteobacteria bacterium]|nr:HAMP domain-containing protein [Deltaproteobacteria bacterium]